MYTRLYELYVSDPEDLDQLGFEMSSALFRFWISEILQSIIY